MVEFRGVSKTYSRATGGRVEALADLTLEIKAGELVAVTGPGGSGKSTLLRLATGEERPTRGQVVVDGLDVGALGRRGLARLRRECGIVAEELALLADRTVFGNVTLVLQALGLPRTEAVERALEALQDVGLTARRNALASELAGGERARLGLARALAPTPRLLIADEPTAWLDAAATAELVTLLRAVRDRGTTVLVATRLPQVARDLDGRILSLEMGRLRPEALPG
jgi:D-methionine transport system ATP-binding protein